MKQLADRTKDGAANFDMSTWLHLFAFECLSEINVSKKLGFLERGQDVYSMIESADKIFHVVGIVCMPPAVFVPCRLYN